MAGAIRRCRASLSAIRAWDVIRYADGAERAVRSAPSAVCQPVRSGPPGRAAVVDAWRRKPGACSGGRTRGTRVGMPSCFVPSLPAAS
jgi:hypothetical protein